MQVGNQSFGDLIIEIGSWNFFFRIRQNGRYETNIRMP
jgi:hypothetical protein